MQKQIHFLTLLILTLSGVPAAAQTGGVHGVVRFVNEYPEPETLRITKDLEVCGTKKADETFVVSSDTKGLMNAVITLVGGNLPEFPPPSTATIRQKDCRYDPHVQVVRPGTELEIYNQDPLLHNIHAFQETETLFNLAQPKYLKVIKRTLEQPGIVRIRCDVHSWMDAWVVVTEDPYFALTDSRGAYRFEEIPPGTYKVHFWHEALGNTEKEAIISPGVFEEVNFEIGE